MYTVTINVASPRELLELGEVLGAFNDVREAREARQAANLDLPFQPQKETTEVTLTVVDPTGAEIVDEWDDDADDSVELTIVELRAAISEFAKEHGTETAKKILDEFGGGVSKIESQSDRARFIVRLSEFAA